MAKFDGFEALKRKFKALPQVVRAEVIKVMPNNASELVAMQKRLVPRDKGNLQNSIRYEIVAGLRANVIAGGTAQTRRELRKGSGKFSDEALFVEFGTKAHKAGGLFKGARIPAQPARPFFFPAYRALKKRLRGRLSRSITTGIKKVAAGGS